MPFQIFIKEKKTITLNIEYDTTIQELRKMIYEVMSIPNKLYYLSTGNKILVDKSRTISDYNIKPESTILICIRSSNREVKIKK
jgi:hypothetical protein